MEMVSLTASARSTELTPQALRRSGQVPCVVYGNHTENIALQCEHNQLLKVYAKAGKSSIVDLDASGKKVPALFHAIDFDPVSDRITHVDFYAVDMKKEIEATVPIEYVGEAPAVKELGGVMVTARDSVAVKCLPTNLPRSIEVNVEKLEDFTSSLSVADLMIPEGVAVQVEPETVIATVQEPRKEEEPIVSAEEVAEGEEGAEAEGETKEGEAKEGEGEAKPEGGEEKKPEGKEKKG